MKILHLLLATFFLIAMNAFAQNEIINVWSGEIPNSIKNPKYAEEKIIENGEAKRVLKVSVPQLIVFKPAEPNGTAVLILPGGGYAHLSMQKEGKKVAQWLNSLGITAFVLKYRLPDDRIMTDKMIVPLQDAQEAMRMIRRNADKWNIDPNKLGVIGFSAGGHLAGMLSNRFNENTYITRDNTGARPDFAILLYPVVSMQDNIAHQGSRKNLLGENPSQAMKDLFSNELCVNPDTPPTFIIHAADDKSVPVENSLLYFAALKKKNIPAELHIYERGGHGFGLTAENTAASWPSACVKWLQMHLYRE